MGESSMKLFKSCGSNSRSRPNWINARRVSYFQNIPCKHLIMPPELAWIGARITCPSSYHHSKSYVLFIFILFFLCAWYSFLFALFPTPTQSCCGATICMATRRSTPAGSVKYRLSIPSRYIFWGKMINVKTLPSTIPTLIEKNGVKCARGAHRYLIDFFFLDCWRKF